MNNETYNLCSLTKDELTIILESLLFSASTDICADWYKEDTQLACGVAEKIRKMFPEIIIKNVYLHESENHEFYDEHSSYIKQIFPEITKDLKIQEHINK